MYQVIQPITKLLIDTTSKICYQMRMKSFKGSGLLSGNYNIFFIFSKVKIWQYLSIGFLQPLISNNRSRGM
ncbi:hypothetical protein pb186bvf_014188 [Paramecium bursaria]